jgi:hypothetical protein
MDRGVRFSISGYHGDIQCRVVAHFGISFYFGNWRLGEFKLSFIGARGVVGWIHIYGSRGRRLQVMRPLMLLYSLAWLIVFTEWIRGHIRTATLVSRPSASDPGLYGTPALWEPRKHGLGSIVV